MGSLFFPIRVPVAPRACSPCLKDRKFNRLRRAKTTTDPTYDLTGIGGQANDAVAEAGNRKEFGNSLQNSENRCLQIREHVLVFAFRLPWSYDPNVN